jgi:hypothetical protein
MKLRRTTHFERNYATAPQQVQRGFDKQSLLLLQNLHHPSLHAKKYDESWGLWQARINKDWRVYFFVQDEVYLNREHHSSPKIRYDLVKQCREILSHPAGMGRQTRLVCRRNRR